MKKPKQAARPDGMLVGPEHVFAARQETAAAGLDQALAALRQSEPALAGYLAAELIAISGKLALSGAPTHLIQGAHTDLLTLILTCVQALRRGHYELWKDTLTGTRLAQLDPAFRPKRRRKKPESGQDEQGPA